MVVVSWSSDPVVGVLSFLPRWGNMKLRTCKWCFMWMYQHGIWCETNTILCTELWSLYVCNGRIYVICVGNIIFCTPSWLIVQPNVFFHLFYLSSHCLLCNPPPCNSVTSHTYTHTYPFPQTMLTCPVCIPFTPLPHSPPLTSCLTVIQVPSLPFPFSSCSWTHPHSLTVSTHTVLLPLSWLNSSLSVCNSVPHTCSDAQLFPLSSTSYCLLYLPSFHLFPTYITSVLPWSHCHSSSHIPSSSLPHTHHLSDSPPPVLLIIIFVLAVISHSLLSCLEL